MFQPTTPKQLNSAIEPSGGALPGMPGPGDAAGASSRKYRSTQPVLLAVLAIASAGSIFAMRTFAGKEILSDDARVIDYSHTIDPARSQNYDRIMIDLARLDRPLEVDVDIAAARAFGAVDAPVAVSVGGENPQDAASREQTRRKHELMTKASSLRVQSVLGGRRPVARISGEAYGVGDTVAEVFKVTQIDGRGVTLMADGLTFTLTMEAPQQRRVPSGKR